jgi:hypothetical protein
MYGTFPHKSKAQGTLWRKVHTPQVVTIRQWGFAGKVRSKVHPITCYEAQSGRRGIAVLFL